MTPNRVPDDWKGLSRRRLREALAQERAANDIYVMKLREAYAIKEGDPDWNRWYEEWALATRR